MKKKSALVGLMMIVMGAGCSNGGKDALNPVDADNSTGSDNVSRSERTGGTFFPFLLGYLLGSRGGMTAAPTPGAAKAESPAAVNGARGDANQGQTAVAPERGIGQKSNLSARGSSSMRGSMGS